MEAQGSFLPTSDNFVKERTLSVGSSRRTSKTTQKFSAGLAFRGGVQLSSWSPYVKLGANLGLRRFEFKSEDLSGNQLPITNTSNAFESTLSVGMGSDIPLDFCKVRVEYTCGIALTKAKKTFKDRDNDTITQSFKASPSHRLSVGAILPLKRSIKKTPSFLKEGGARFAFLNSFVYDGMIKTVGCPFLVFQFLLKCLKENQANFDFLVGDCSCRE